MCRTTRYSFVFVIIRSNYWQCCYCEAWWKSPWKFWCCFCYLSFYLGFPRKSVGNNEDSKRLSVTERDVWAAMPRAASSPGFRRRARLLTPALRATRGMSSRTSRSRAYLFDIIFSTVFEEKRTCSQDIFLEGENACKVPVHGTPDATRNGDGGGGTHYYRDVIVSKSSVFRMFNVYTITKSRRFQIPLA